MKKEVTVAIVSAVLASVGSTIGVFITFQLSEKAWDRQVSYDERRIVLKHRIELIERFAKVIAHLDEIKKNLALIEIDKTARLAALDQGKTPPIISEFSEKLSNRNIALEAEYSAVLSLMPIYFGPNSKEAVEKLLASKVWYEPNEDEINYLYEALSNELYWF